MVEIKYLVTSALPYVNGDLHLGHLVGCLLPADVYTRFLRSKGEKAIYVCGNDEYGTPIVVAAEKQGLAPKQLADKFHERHKQALEGFNIRMDIFSRTTTPEHTKVVQDFYYYLKQNGFIFRKEIEQYYCEHCKKFLPDRYIEGKCPYCGAEGARGDQCEECGKPLITTELIEPYCVICKDKPVLKKEEHVFFDLPRVEKELRGWVEKHEGMTANAKNFAVSFIKEGLREKDISRNMEWGVPIPDAEGLVFYVWFDAPIGYITFTKQLGKMNWWRENDTQLVHFLGKDNIVFHTVFFPGMLIAEGEFILPSKVIAYEYLRFSGSKLSKSKGTMIKALDAVRALPADYWRYALLSALPENKDYNFTWEFLEEKTNELNDVIGNFIHRTLTFAKKFFNNIVEKPELTQADEEMVKEVGKIVKKVEEAMHNVELKKALGLVVGLARKANQYITAEEPWKKEERKKAVTYTCLHVAKALAVLLKPFIPESSEKILEYLGLENKKWDDVKILEEKFIIKEFKPLFKKVEIREVIEKINKKEEENMIKYDDFAKLDLRVGEVVKAEKVEGADKLLKLTVDIGGEERTLAAGLAKYYKPEELEGKKIIVLVNLEPKKLRGVESQGMLLAAEEGSNVVLLTVDKDIKSGAKVR